MTLKQDIDLALDSINIATNQIAEILRDIAPHIGKMTKDEIEVAKARLESVAVSLDSIASSGLNDPVPVSPV